jgi:midasin (ATPase involved in ribosome maturation)
LVNYAQYVPENHSLSILIFSLIGKLIGIVIFGSPLLALFYLDKPYIAIVYTIIISTFYLKDKILNDNKNEISETDQYEELRSCLGYLKFDNESTTQAYRSFIKVLNSKNSILKKRICHRTIEKLFLRLLSPKKYSEETFEGGGS